MNKQYLKRVDNSTFIFVPPQKGVDFWTPADQESIVQQVITALGTPVFGRVDADNNIILTGNLANGSYTLKYEDAEGEVTEIGTIEVGAVQIDNLITKSIDENGDTYGEDYNGDGENDGYKNGYRLSTGDGLTEKTNPATSLTGYIPVNNGDIIRLANMSFIKDSADAYKGMVYTYSALGVYIDHADTTTVIGSWNGMTDSNGNVTQFTVTQEGVAFIRIAAAEITGSSIITKNQEEEPAYTNVIPASIGSDKALYNGGKGYKEGYRLNSSANETAQSGMCVTGFIPVNYGDTIRFANITMNPKQGVTGYNYVYVYLYDENFARITPGAYLTGNNNAFPAASENVAFDSDGNVTMVKIDKSVFTSMEATTTIKYVRISAQSITNESIITVNQEIPEEESAYTNLFDPATATLNTRMSGTTGAPKTENGYVMTALIPIPETAVTKTSTDAFIAVPASMWSASANMFLSDKDGTATDGYCSYSTTKGEVVGAWVKIPLLTEWGTGFTCNGITLSLKVGSSAITASDLQDVEIYFNEIPE